MEKFKFSVKFKTALSYSSLLAATIIIAAADHWWLIRP